MSQSLQSFLSIRPEAGTFADAAWRAAVDIAKEEGMTGYRQLNNGTRVDNRVDTSGWLVLSGDVSGEVTQSQLRNAVQHMDESGRVLLYRGTKLPAPDMGTFQFKDGGVHVSPDLGIATGYATGVNSETGVGRLLQTSSPHQSIGFLSTWSVPLDEKLWRNFEYEEYLGGHKEVSNRTAHDLRTTLHEHTLIPAKSLDVVTTPEGTRVFSDTYANLTRTVQHDYYEAIVGNGTKPQDIFVKGSDGQLIKIDSQNPKWDAWMARIHEASMRDLYEIQPLQRALKQLHHVEGASVYPLLDSDRLFVDVVTRHVETKLNDTLNQPFQHTTLTDATTDSQTKPWIKESTRVGSFTSGTQRYSTEIEVIRSVTDSLVVGRVEEARELAVKSKIVGKEHLPLKNLAVQHEEKAIAATPKEASDAVVPRSKTEDLPYPSKSNNDAEIVVRKSASVKPPMPNNAKVAAGGLAMNGFVAAGTTAVLVGVDVLVRGRAPTTQDALDIAKGAARVIPGVATLQAQKGSVEQAVTARSEVVGVGVISASTALGGSAFGIGAVPGALVGIGLSTLYDEGNRLEAGCLSSKNKPSHEQVSCGMITNAVLGAFEFAKYQWGNTKISGGKNVQSISSQVTPQPSQTNHNHPNR